MPALFYFHVAKTAGNSMVSEIRQNFAESEIVTDGGNLTLPFLEAYGKQRLRDAGFLHGHVGPGAATYLQDIADTILLLRDPMDHVISHYLYLAREPGHLHSAATELGFRDFIMTYPAVLVFQTISLTNGLGQIVPPERPYDCIPDMLRYLESTFLLGTVDQIDEFMACLARIKQWPAPVSVGRLNKVPPRQMRARAEFEDAYNAVASSTHYGATLIAVEQAIYAAAKNIAAVQRERRSLSTLGETARRVWQSANGEIVLGHNFGRREMIDGEPAWWTLEAPESHVLVAAQTPTALRADIRVWHAAGPISIQVWMDQRRVDARIEQTADGLGSLMVPLAGCGAGQWTTITLRLDPRDSPAVAPWYPTMLLYGFRLV